MVRRSDVYVMLRPVVIVLLVFARGAAADPPADPAEAAYQEGRRLYDLREWDQAIAKFREAYRLRPDAKSLYNIAQSYRLEGNCGEAVAFYKTYKRNYPEATNLDQVDGFITELQPCADKAAPPKPQPQPIKPITPPKREGPAPVERRSQSRLGFVVAGGGVALVGTGFLFGAAAKRRANEVNANGNLENPQPFDSDLETRGKRDDLIAKISWVVGGAAIIGGVVWIVRGRRSDARVGVVPNAGGAVLVWGRPL